MKIGFVTCVQLGLSCIEAIYESGGKLDLIITLNDDKAINKSGRVYLDEFCSSTNVPLLKINHINDSIVADTIKNLKLDWLFIIGWSQIAGKAVLDAPLNGVLGIHPTLLPVGRGRAAIPWAILKGLDKTGVTLFKLDSGVDTGPIAAQYIIPLSPTVTATELYSAVDAAHTALIKQIMPQIICSTLTLEPQDESLATVWDGRKPEDGKIDLDGSVRDAERLVRAVTHPYPGAFFESENGQIIIWRATMSDSVPEEKAIKFNDGYLILNDWELV